jgi:hypothetical protein
MKHTICTKPFEWLELNNHPRSGEAYLCCPWWLPRSIGNVFDADAKALWHSAEASAIRASVIDGSFRHCTDVCPYKHSPDAPESPIKTVDDAELARYQQAVADPVGQLPAPEIINCAYDRSCNLACPSCRSEILQASREERTEYDALIHGVLESFADKATTLYVTGGGDPFASRHYWELLQRDLPERYPALRLRLHTNGILLNPVRWKKMAHWHGKINLIEVSIDGGDATSYELNRPPARWEQLQEAMAFIASVRQDYPALCLKINCVVQANNWRSLRALLQQSEQWGADIVKLSKIVNWGTYTDEAFRKVAVHLRSHPDNAAFMASLQDPVFRAPGIMMDDFAADNVSAPVVIATDREVEWV